MYSFVIIRLFGKLFRRFGIIGIERHVVDRRFGQGANHEVDPGNTVDFGIELPKH